MYRQPWFTGVPWQAKCMGHAVVVWGGGSRYCAEHALTGGPPEWFHEAVGVTAFPECPPGIAEEARERECVLRTRADGSDGLDWRTELIAVVKPWAARDGVTLGSFPTEMAQEPDGGNAQDVTLGRVRLALACAIAEGRRLGARAEQGSTRPVIESETPEERLRSRRSDASSASCSREPRTNS